MVVVVLGGAASAAARNRGVNGHSGPIAPQWFTDMVETQPRQGALLLCFLCLLVPLILLESMRTQIRKVPSNILRSNLTMLALLATAILDMIYPDYIHGVLISIASLGLTLHTTLSMCEAFPGQMHAVLTIMIVLPSALISNLANNLTVPIRCTLLLPPLTFTIYKVFAYACERLGLKKTSDSPSTQIQDRKAYMELFISATCSLILLGSSIAAAAVAFDRQDSERLFGKLGWEYGLIIASICGIEFNAFLIVRKWKSPPTGVQFDADYSFGILGILLLAGFNLFGIYLCFTFCRVALFIPLITLFVLFFVVVLMLDPVHKMISNCAYFFLILLALIATVVLVSLPAPLLQRLPSGANTTRSIEPMVSDNEKRYLRETAWLTALGCGLFFTHFMMIALFKTDQHAKQNSLSVSSSEEARKMLNDTSTSQQSTATSPVTASKGCSAQAEKKIGHKSVTQEESEDDRFHRDFVKYTTLNVPDKAAYSDKAY